MGVMYKMPGYDPHSDPNHPDQPKRRGKRGRRRTMKWIKKPINQFFDHVEDAGTKEDYLAKLAFIRGNPINIDRTLDLYHAVYDNERPMVITAESIRTALLFQEGIAILNELNKRRHQGSQVYIRYLTEGLMMQDRDMVIRTIGNIKRTRKRFSANFNAASGLSNDINNILALLETSGTASAPPAPPPAAGAASGAAPPPPAAGAASGAAPAPQASAPMPPAPSRLGAASMPPAPLGTASTDDGLRIAEAKVAEARAKTPASKMQIVLNAVGSAAKYIYSPKAIIRNIGIYLILVSLLYGMSQYHGNTNTGHALGVLAKTAEHASILYTAPANYVMDVATSNAKTAIETRLCNPHLSNGLKIAFTTALFIEDLKHTPGHLLSSFQTGVAGSEVPRQGFDLPPAQTTSGFEEGQSLSQPQGNPIAVANQPRNLRGKTSAAPVKSSAKQSVGMSSSSEQMQLDHQPRDDTLNFVYPSSNWVHYLEHMLPQEDAFMGACVAQASSQAHIAYASRPSGHVSEEARLAAFHAGASVKTLLKDIAKSANSVGEDAETGLTVGLTVARTTLETVARFGEMFFAILEELVSIIPEIAFAGGGSRRNKITRKYKKNVISRGTKRTHRRTQYKNQRTTRKLLAE